MSFKNFIKQSMTELQQKTADRIGGHINKYSVRKRKIGLVVFGLLIGSFCLMLIIGIVGSDQSPEVLKVDNISVPKDIHPSAMDSLKSLPSKVLDSLEAIIKQLYKERIQHH